MIGKGAYLKQLTAATLQMKSVNVGKELEGSSPPSVFIGSWNYPDVYRRSDDCTPPWGHGNHGYA